jgi:hypothetical protein
LRAGLTLALRRFELFLRVATRFFALAMAVPSESMRRQANLEASQLMLTLYNNPLIWQRIFRRARLRAGCALRF